MLQQLRAEQQQRWQQGDKVSVDAYVRQHPELVENTEALCELILGEMVLREGLGERPRLEEYVRHFPKCADRLTERYWHEMATALPAAATLDMPGGIGPTLNISPSHSAETIQLDEAGQLAAQQEAFVQGAPQIPGYLILAELGRGGMGVVYRAKQLAANRDVALKVVRNDVLDTLPLPSRNSTLARFRHEAHAAARLEHDNLVPVYDVGEAGGLRYYAMRFVEGTSLYDMLRNKALSNQDAARYIEPVARGLHYAHEKGVLHRDLKPHNIIVEAKSGRPMLTDFGLAKFLEERNELTHAGDVMGTPSYMSPEQARDSGKVTPLADVYSLGATLYHVLTARPPFQAANIAETIRQVLDAEPVAPRRLNPAIDSDLETICLKCLQKEPARRYASALALADDLQRYLEHKPILARPAGMVERTWRWCRRNPRLAGTAALASLLLVFWVASMVSGYYKAVLATQRAHGLIDDLFTEISEEELLNEPGKQKLRDKLLSKALVHYQELLGQSGGARWIQDEVAGAHYRIGFIRGEMGQFEDAQAELNQAIAAQQALLQATPQNGQRLLALADSLSALGRLLAQQEQFTGAAAQYARANELRIQAAVMQPNDLEIQRKLASVEANLGTVELNQGEELRDQGDEQQGHELQTRGRSHIADAQKRRLEILQKDRGLSAARRELAMGYFMLARFDSRDYFKLPEPRSLEAATPAIENLRQAVGQFELLDSKELANRYIQAVAYRQLGGLLTNVGKLDEAADAFAKAQPLCTVLAFGNPDVGKYQSEYVGLAMNQAELFQRQNDLPAAQEAWLRATNGCRELLKQDGSSFQSRYDLATSLDALAENYRIMGDIPAQIAQLESAQMEIDNLLKSADESQRASLGKWSKAIGSDLQAARQKTREEDEPASSIAEESADKSQ
jgi:predicted Ser/Thr protein kinase/tetratricopeptide (TPR) repeat protein